MKVNGCGQAKILNDAEFNALFERGLRYQRDRTLFHICYYTACRAGEARNLQVSHVFDGQRIRDQITIPKAVTKGQQLGGAENFWESHAENLTTLENSIRVSKVSRLRFEAQAGGGLA